MTSVAAQPFLKWAGGKRQLLPALRRFYPRAFGDYFEPFLGSGAVFFDLHARELLRGRRATISDSNPDLIACYAALRDDPESIIEQLHRLAENHQRRGAQHYYEVRNNHFNPQRRTLAEASAPVRYSPSLAAMFIYLNRTGYNGLFRLNARGDFNVPAGRYVRPRICDEDNLRRVAAALNSEGVALKHQPFDRAADVAREGDFLYFDPPYSPLTSTARFTSYTAVGFGTSDQRRLRDLLVTLARRGCQIVMSNSTAPEITRLYSPAEAVSGTGLRCHTVPARRAINSKAQGRGSIPEYVISNVTAQPHASAGRDLRTSRARPSVRRGPLQRDSARHP